MNSNTETSLDVAACVERVRQRDEEAARELFRYLLPLVQGLVRRHLPRRSSEEDLIQAVFMKIFANLDSFSGTVPLTHWVSRIAINTCLNQISSEKSRPEWRWADLSEEQMEALETAASETDNLDASHSLASREIVDKLLEQLSPEDRLVITLLHMEGRTVSEVQQITGWNAPVIKIRAFRARQKLRKKLDHLLSEKPL